MGQEAYTWNSAEATKVLNVLPSVLPSTESVWVLLPHELDGANI